MKQAMTIGVLGGMGTYATIHMFQKYAEIFPAEKEWDRPRIIIDNRCTMPSRCRAYFHGEQKDKLIDEMCESIENLVNAGCTHIILACNTSHLFLPNILERIPASKNLIWNIIDICGDELCRNNIHEAYLLASEGTIDSGVYERILKARNIKCNYPSESMYIKLRECIEAVKQNKYSEDVCNTFLNLIENAGNNIILGCTELPILYEKYQDKIPQVSYFDPLEITLRRIKEMDYHE